MLLPRPPAETDDLPVVMRAGDAAERWGRSFVRNQLAHGRWQRPARGVVVRHNGPLSPSDRSWVRLLSCAPGAALAGLDALWWDGFSGFTHDRTQIVLPPGATPPTDPQIEPHWSIYLDRRDVDRREPRRTRPARSLVDAATWCSNDRLARAIVIAGVQQGMAPTRGLRDALTRRGTCLRRALTVQSILDAVGGIQSLPERDFDEIVLSHRLPRPTRQSPVRRGDGRYYLDIEWREYGAGCEVHGIPHLEVRHWDADNVRANEVAILGPRLLVFSSFAVRHEPETVADQVARLLRRGGWSG